MNRSTLILFLLLIVLGAIAYFLIPSSKEREKSDANPDVSYTIDSASVVRIDIIRGGKTMTLENVGGKWMLTSPGKYAADPLAVLQVLQGLSKFKIGSLISSNPEKQKLFQVDTTGTQITTVDRGGKSSSIIIGKMGPSFSEVYCRMPGSKNVFLGEGLDSWTVNKEAKDWRDKSISSIPSESIKGLTYAINNRQFEYVRDSTSWKLGQSNVETAVMNPPLASLANLKAEDFIDTAMKFSSDPVSVSVKGIDNFSLHLYPLAPDSSKYYVQSSASSQLYVISKYAAQQILKPVEQLAGFSKPVSKPVMAKKEEIVTPPQNNAGKMRQQPAPVQSANVSPQKKEPLPTKNGKPGQSAAAQPIISERQSAPAGQAADVSASKKATAKKPPVDTPPQQKIVPAASGEALITDKPVQPTPPSAAPQVSSGKAKPTDAGTMEDEGELTVYTVKSGDTMPVIAKKYNCSVEQILKWNLLKSIGVKPGQELYIYVKK